MSHSKSNSKGKRNCKCHKCHQFSKHFEGSYGPRENQLLDDPLNSTTHSFTVNKSDKLEVSLTHDNPSAVMHLFLYDESSYFSKQIVPNQGEALEEQLASTYRADTSGDNPATISITENLLPGRYAVRVVLVEGEGDTSYTVTVKGNIICRCKRRQGSTCNPLVGFWKSETKGFLNSLLIRERCDGSLFLQRYNGHDSVGFQKRALFWYIAVSIPFTQDLEKIADGVYRFRRYEERLIPPDGITYDQFFTISLDQTNKDGLIGLISGAANPIWDTYITYYTRVDNYQDSIIEFQDSVDYSNPVTLLDIYTKQLLLANNAQVNKDMNAGDFPGFNEMVALKDTLLETGIEKQFTGLNVWPEHTLFEEGFPIDGPITTYAQVVLQDTQVFVGADFVGYFDPNSSLEVGVTVALSGILNAAPIGIPNEWLNTYYLVQGLDSGFVVLVPQILTASYPVPGTFIDVPFLTVTPYSFKLQHNLSSTFGFRLLDEFNDLDAFVLRLDGYASVGGLDAQYINGRRVTAYTAADGDASFIQIPGGEGANDVFATSDATGPASTFVIALFYPFSSQQMSLYNSSVVHLPPTPMTTLFTDLPPLANPYTHIELAGLTGEYARLNGTWNVHWQDVFDCKTTKDIWKPGFDVPDRPFSLRIEAPSDGLPSFNPATHTENGTDFSVKHLVRRVRADSDYGTLGGAINYMSKTMGVMTHGFTAVYDDVIKGVRDPSFALIQQSVTLNAQATQFVNPRGRDPLAVTYYNPRFTYQSSTYVNELNSDAYGNIPGAPINPDLRFDPSLPPNGFDATGNLVAQYVDPDTLHNVYAKISGPVLNQRVPGSDPDNKNISNFLTDFGANANGTVITYETLPSDDYIPFGITVNTPFQKRFTLVNGFSDDGFVPEEVSGDIILADPLLAGSLLQADCAGKIVLIRRGTVSFEDKYVNAVNAGATCVIIFNNVPGPLTNTSTGGVNLGVPLYTMSDTDGEALAGYDGVGPINDTASYAMPTTDPTGYNGDVGFPPIVADRRLLVGDPQYQFGKIRREFSSGKNIGYIYLPNSIPRTSLSIDASPEFRDIYGVTNRVDLYAKQFAVIMTTVVDGIKFADMDAIIVDNSANLGGDPLSWQAFGTLFGNGDRAALSFNTNIVFADNGNTPALLYADTLKKICPDIPLDLLLDPEAEKVVPVTKYQALYPKATFTGNKVVHLTSTTAYSAGDMYHHYFRNHQGPDYSDIGGGVRSVLIGALDGRLLGSSTPLPSTGVANLSGSFHVAPSVNGPEVHLPPFQVYGEGYSGAIDSYSGEYITNQLPYIAVDGLNGGGPIDAWVENEGGVYQAFGFTTPYARATPQYQVFNDVIGIPDAFDPSTRHYPWLEDAILEACQ